MDIDFKLRLFGGRPIFVDGYGYIKPLKIKEIIDIGYTEYLKYLNIITLDINDFFPDQSTNINVFDFLISYGEPELKELFEGSLSLFLNGKAIIDKEEFAVYVKDKENGEVHIVNSDNYGAIQEVIKWQNYINSFDEKKLEDFNPANEEARRLKERMDAIAKKRDELKRKQQEIEKNEEDDIDFFDILSAISSKSFGVNELNVMDLTIYQVYRKFKRLEVIDQYDISIKSILAGAKDIKLKHWSSKV